MRSPTWNGSAPSFSYKRNPTLILPLTGILAVFAKFERDILRDRVKAGIA
jgi:hypothetical protein